MDPCKKVGIPIRPDELRAAANLIAADTYKGELVLLALAQILERLEQLETDISTNIRYGGER